MRFLLSAFLVCLGVAGDAAILALVAWLSWTHTLAPALRLPGLTYGTLFVAMVPAAAWMYPVLKVLVKTKRAAEGRE